MDVVQKCCRDAVDKVPFLDWFNVNRKEHILALKTFLETDAFPKFFIPADVAFPSDSSWKNDLLIKLVNQIATPYTGVRAGGKLDYPMQGMDG